jgi:hypothetical protein
LGCVVRVFAAGCRLPGLSLYPLPDLRRLSGVGEYDEMLVGVLCGLMFDLSARAVVRQRRRKGNADATTIRLIALRITPARERTNGSTPGKSKWRASRGRRLGNSPGLLLTQRPESFMKSSPRVSAVGDTHSFPFPGFPMLQT